MVLSRTRVTLRDALVGLATLVLALAILMLTGGMARASLTYPYTGNSFGPNGLGAGSFSKVVGVVVDQSNGDVLVYDNGAEGRGVYKFSETGEPVNFSALGTNVITDAGSAGVAEAEIAVDSSGGPDAGDIYVANNNVVRVYAASGTFLGELTGGEMCGVAVDPSGAVYVGIYPGIVRKYTPVTNPATNADETASMEGLNEICNVAADGEGNVYAATYSGGISRYDALQFGSVAATGTIVSEQGSTMAVDPSTNDLYINNGPTVSQYDSSGVLLGQSGAGNLSSSYGVAIKSGSGGHLYAPGAEDTRVDIFGPATTLAGATTQAASNVTESSATINGSINPHGAATTYQFEYGTSTEYGSVLPASPANVGSDSTAHSLSAELGGLAQTTTYHYRIVAISTNGTSVGADETFRTKRAPLVDAESFSGVGSSSASLSAQVNDFGFVSTYRYEYGTSSSYGSSTPESILGASEGDTGAPAVLSGLEPSTIYHFRVVVTNEAGTAHGVDSQFTTLPASTSGLPDERVYEMVTPPSNQDADVYIPNDDGEIGATFSAHPAQASADGIAVAYAADPTSGGNGSRGSGRGNQYVAIRSESGWSQVDVQPPGEITAEYQGFSTDLSTGFLDACGVATLAPSAPGGGYDVLYSHVIDSGGYAPFFTTKPPNRSSAEFRDASLSQSSSACLALVYAGESSDGGHVLFEANDALTPAASVTPPTSSENDLYDLAGGQLNVVNVLPGSSAVVAPNATFGSYWSILNVDFGHAVSSNGSRIFWTDRNTGDLFVREDSGTASAKTVQVDASVGGGGRFWTASSSGSRVFFTKAGSLYAFDVDTSQTTDLAPGGEILGLTDASEDGSHVYYVADAALAGGASAGHPNLYLSRYEEGGWVSPVFIATLSPSDNEEGSGGGGDWHAGLSTRRARTTPDGHKLVFQSVARLTDYDNAGRAEVYTYDSEDNKLLCASCNPSGEPPTGLPFFLPVSLPISKNKNYLRRWISADGNRVFFDASISLVPNDLNGRSDVYEWERDGAGGCEIEKGCIFLLSGGASTAGSYFIDASANGDDVFIATRAQLSSVDQNENMDLYDVRANGTSPPSPSACSGSGCQGVPPAPPIFATPSSVTFNGVGNFPPPSSAAVKQKSKTPTRAQRLSRALRACAKKQQRKRASCRALARKRYGAKSRAKNPTKGRK